MADKNEKIIDDFFDKSNKTVENLIIDLRPQDNQINEKASIANRFDIVARARLAAEKFYDNLNLRFKNDKNIVFGDTITPNGVDRQTAFKLVIDKNNQIRLDRQITETKPGLLYGNTKKETNESAVLTPDQLARFKGLDRIEQLLSQQRVNQTNAVAATQELIVNHVQFKQKVEKSIQGLEPVKDGNKRTYDKAVEAAGKTIKADLEKTLKALEGPMANLYTDPKVAREKAVEQIDSLSKTAVAVTPAISKVDLQREFADLANRSAAPDAAGITPQRSEEDLRKRLADVALRVEIEEIAGRAKIDLGGLDEAARDLSDYYKNNPANRPADFSSGALIEQASKDAREKIVKQVELALGAEKPVVQNDIAQSQARLAQNRQPEARAQSSGADDLISRIRAGTTARDARDANPNLPATIEPEGKHINELQGNQQAGRSGQEPKSPEAVLSEKLHAAAREVALNENSPTEKSQEALNKAAQDLVKFNQENGTGIGASAEQVVQNAIWLEAARITKEQAAPSIPQPTIVALPPRPEGKVENATAAVPTPTVPAANAVTPEPIAVAARNVNTQAQPAPAIAPAPAAAKAAPVAAAIAAPIAANTAGSQDPRRAAVRPEIEKFVLFQEGVTNLNQAWKNAVKQNAVTATVSGAAQEAISKLKGKEFYKFDKALEAKVLATFPANDKTQVENYRQWRNGVMNELKSEVKSANSKEDLIDKFFKTIGADAAHSLRVPGQPAATREGAAAVTAGTTVPPVITIPTPAGARGAAAIPAATGPSNPEEIKKAAIEEIAKFLQLKSGAERFQAEYPATRGVSEQKVAEVVSRIDNAVKEKANEADARIQALVRNSFPSTVARDTWVSDEAIKATAKLSSMAPETLKAKFVEAIAGTSLAKRLAPTQVNTLQAATSTPRAATVPVAVPAAGNAKRIGLDDDDFSAAGKLPAQVKTAAAPEAPLKPTPPIAANNGKPVTLDSLIDDMFAKRAAPPVQTAAATNETTPKLTRADTKAINENLNHIAAYLVQNPELDRRPIERLGLGR